MAPENACPVCGSTAGSPFFEVRDVPVHVGLQWPSREAARDCPKGDIALALCSGCGHITNMAFDPARLEYTQDYDNTLYYSGVFREYSRSVAERLIDRYGVRNKNVVEIGCGKGDFLVLLCELGDNHGLGFDPSYEPDRTGQVDTARIEFVRDFYSAKYAARPADLICCRFVFEHIYNPVEFLADVRRSIGSKSDTVVYIEVPNVMSILRDLAIWDIIYEHCSHFSRASLARTFTQCGFEVRDLYESYDGQYLSIEAVPCTDAGESGRGEWGRLDEIRSSVESFTDKCRSKMDAWRADLDRIERARRRTVVWGAGSKAVSFLNMLGIHDQIEVVVDINPHKQGKYIAGTGQQIVSPDYLRDYRPDVVIVMNPVYKSEIEQTMTRSGLTAELVSA